MSSMFCQRYFNCFSQIMKPNLANENHESAKPNRIKEIHSIPNPNIIAYITQKPIQCESTIESIDSIPCNNAWSTKQSYSMVACHDEHDEYADA